MNSKNRKTTNTDVRSRDRSKANLTKERLISNARQVFIEAPYKTGSLRNVCSSHNLVWYHFGSKAKLFNALTSRLAEEISEVIPSFVQEIEKMSPKKGLEHFVKQFLDFMFTHPDSMQIINQNLGNCDESEIGFPGLDIMQAVHQQLFTSFIKILPKYSSEKDLERWCLVFLIYIINFIGAMRASQVALNLKPYRHMYQEWLEDFIVFLLFPSYNHLMVGPQAQEFKDIKIQKPNKTTKPEVIVDDKEKVLSKEDSPKKGDVTREEILKAARMVFTRHPYQAASIRMIGKQSNRDFTLIHHYFPTKEILFQEVARDLFDEVLGQIPLWHQNRPFNSLYEALSISEERAVNFFFDNSDAISLIMQNITNIELTAKVIPVVQYFNQYIDTLLTYSRIPDDNQNQLRMWYVGLIMNYLHLVGASHYFARMLEMNPDSTAYKIWIKDTNILIHYPVLRRLMLSSASE